MIPLMRPEFPNLRAVEKHFNQAWIGRKFTNFGSLFYKATEGLSNLMQGYALPVTSGTTALQVAMVSLGLHGKRVALPDFTHTGTLLAIIQAGGIPILFGASDRTWTLDVEELKKHEDEFDAVIVVSPFGYHVDVPAFEDFSEKYGKPIVYDLAGAFGFFPKTKNIRCYSFHATKNFGIGEGGCVVFSSKEDWDKGLRITNFGTQLDRNIENDQGLNAKPDELKCACILANLEDDVLPKIYRRISNKSSLLNYYQEQFDNAFVPQGRKCPSLVVLGNMPARLLEARGEEIGIICKRYYPLLSRMPGLSHIVRISESSDRLDKCVALPSDVSFAEAHKVVTFVHQCLAED